MSINLLNRYRNKYTAFTHDLIMVPFAWLLAYWLRFNLGVIPEPYWNQGVLLLPMVVLIQAGVFWYVGLYRGVWRFASMQDLFRILQSAAIGTLIVLGAAFLLTRLQDIPRSVFPLYAIVLAGLISGPRFLYRWIKDHRLYTGSGKRTMIIGAGRAGELLARDLMRDPYHRYQPVLFMDDDARKIDREIHGLRVYGPCDNIPKLAADKDIDLIMIALPSASSADMQRIVQFSEQAGIPFRTLPMIEDLVSGKVSISELRPVSIADLLGREQVTLDWGAIGKEIGGRCVMVSGGGGSIGSELCRQIVKLGPGKLIVYDQSEYNLYQIDLELRKQYPATPLVSLLGDVTDEASIGRLFEQYHPEIIFHAAAYKHVPLLENQIRIAATNNVVGTCVLAEYAYRYNAEAFVLVSTDKAVNPANVMGMTKRAAEIYCQTVAERSQTRFITVRFGNVLDSAGSVIPLFRNQIAAGGPVTVTHPDIERFFMTIPEASQLILQASAIGKGGEIFVLDMGEPIKIRYLAEQMILLSGKVPDTDIKIEFTGLRPGEKLYEELFHEREKHVTTSHPKILLAESRKLASELVEEKFSELRQACLEENEARILESLTGLVPENLREAQTDAISDAPKGSARIYRLDH